MLFPRAPAGASGSDFTENLHSTCCFLAPVPDRTGGTGLYYLGHATSPRDVQPAGVSVSGAHLITLSISPACKAIISAVKTMSLKFSKLCFNLCCLLHQSLLLCGLAEVLEGIFSDPLDRFNFEHCAKASPASCAKHATISATCIA